MMSHSFPLTGDLITGLQAHEWLQDAIASGNQPISICSAYLRSEALKSLLDRLPQAIGGRILVRWKLGDLLAGSSDFDAFAIAQSIAWPLHMRLDFHGKVYSVPPKGVIVGSANATLSGLGISSHSNSEVCTLVSSSAENLKIIDVLFKDSTIVDQLIFDDLQRIAAQADSSAPDANWPSALLARLNKNRVVDKLLVSECLLTAPDWLEGSTQPLRPEAAHDLGLLGSFIRTNATSYSHDSLRAGLRVSSIYTWFRTTLLRLGGESYFGHLSAELHSALLDDPTPSRQLVKDLVQNFLSWVSILNLSEIKIDRPNYSQRVRYVEER